MKQLNLFGDEDDAIELQIQAILASRLKNRCSGVNGEDRDLIRAALEKSKGCAA